MQSLAKQSDLSSLIERLGRLEPSTPRRWGTLTAHEMICHLTDSFEAVLGQRAASSRETWLQRHFVKYLALYVPLPWPKGVPTRPEVDPHRGGTRPSVFERDGRALVAIMRRFAGSEGDRFRHPTFGALNRWEGLRWGWVHTDHHFRQFGIQVRAQAENLHSLAFPAISTGIYGYPLQPATRIAVATVRAARAAPGSISAVVFACFSPDVLAAYVSEGIAAGPTQAR